MYSKYAPKECGNCSKLFICTGTAQCPCFDLVIPENVLEYIASHYDECLCAECIEELKEKMIASPNLV